MTHFEEYFSMPFRRQVMDIEYSLPDAFGDGKDVEGNTELHFRKAIAMGFDGMKADMELTRDGEIVLCHDPGFTLDDNGRIVAFSAQNYLAIHEMDARQALALEFAAADETGKRYHPCTLDTMLGLCEKHGMTAYLTLRPEPWREATAARMVELILAHGMQGRTIINLFTGCRKAVEEVATRLPGLVYCNTLFPDVPLTRKLIDESAADGYRIICLCRAMIDTVTPELVAYAADKGIRVWDWGVQNEAEAAAAIARGISGFQMCSRSVASSVIDGILAHLPENP